MDDGYTRVQFGSLSQAEADFASAYSSLQSTISTLEGQLNAHLAAWTGDAQAAYHAAQAKWNAAMADMATVLNQLGVVVGDANANYQGTERANTGIWS